LQQNGEDAFGNALGNAAIAGINEANAHSEAQQQRQTGTSPDNLPTGDGNWWENGSVFGNSEFGVGAFTPGSTGASGADDYSLIAGDPSKGYPVPVNYTDDPSVIKALYANTVAYVNYENQQPLNYLPAVPGSERSAGADRLQPCVATWAVSRGLPADAGHGERGGNTPEHRRCSAVLGQQGVLREHLRHRR
jgi:hypothetical protein